MMNRHRVARSRAGEQPSLKLVPDAPAPFDVRALLDARGGEAFALHERYLNPQMPRALRTISFDRDYMRAEGAYLFDRDGRRYLDFRAGSVPSRHRTGAQGCDGVRAAEPGADGMLAALRAARRGPGRSHARRLV